MNSQNTFNLYFFRLLLLILSLIVFGLLSALGIFFYLSMDLPDVKQLQNYHPSIPSQVLARDGQLLMEMGLENRELVNIKDIPDVIKNAFMASEDSSFYQHHGVDYMAMLRAFILNIKAGKVVQGGSTITQQVAKQLLLTRERSIVRKIKDIILAQKIEDTFTKDQILYLYLNHVYLGAGHYGIKSAIKGHYNKELHEVNASEAALMAGLLVAPGKISPYLRPEYAKRRQNYVLRRMLELGFLTNEQYDIEISRSLKILMKKSSESKAGYFTEWVRQKIMKDLGPDLILNGGLKIHTTLDYDLQSLAEKAIRDETSLVDKRKGFLGPIKNLYSQEEIINFLIEQRRNILHQESQYFLLTPEGTKKFEQELTQRDEKKIRSSIIDTILALKLNNTFIPKSNESIVKINEKVMAVVLSVQDEESLIYISVAGMIGVIPQIYFQWCHERAKDDSRKYFPLVKKPSTILKKGDVIYVKLKHLKDEIHPRAIFSLEQDVEVQGALLALNPFNGEVLSMVGGRDFQQSQFNRALQSRRQTGSAFKPFIYATALENGYHPGRIIMDTPEALGGQDSSMSWKPKNYDGKFLGPMTFRKALEKSRNIPTVKIAADLGLRKINSFTERIGMQADKAQDLTVALGSFGVTLLDLVASYAIFPGGGKRVEPLFITKIIKPNGDIIDLTQEKEKEKKIKVEKTIMTPAEPENDAQMSNENPFLTNLNQTQVYDQRLAYIMTDLLHGVITSGTGQRTREIAQNIGGKTGTTNRYVDAWFTGFSHNIVTGVWVGLDNNQSLGWSETGNRAALPIWKKYMKLAVEKYGDMPFLRPPGIVQIPINPNTGRILGAGESGGRLEVFADIAIPGKNIIDPSDEKEKNTEMIHEEDYFNIE